MARMNLGPYITFYIDTKTGQLIIENHEYEIFIDPALVNKIIPIKWDKKKGEKFADVAKKRTGREVLIDRRVK